MRRRKASDKVRRGQVRVCKNEGVKRGGGSRCTKGRCVEIEKTRRHAPVDIALPLPSSFLLRCVANPSPSYREHTPQTHTNTSRPRHRFGAPTALTVGGGKSNALLHGVGSTRMYCSPTSSLSSRPSVCSTTYSASVSRQHDVHLGRYNSVCMYNCPGTAADEPRRTVSYSRGIVRSHMNSHTRTHSRPLSTRQSANQE